MLRSNKLKRARLIVPASVNKLSSKIFYTQLVLLSVGFALGIIALARPQWGQRMETIFVNGRNVAILVDVSRSMLAEDVHPNRLERSKADLVDLVEASSGERISIIAFRNGARLLCPFTSDMAFVLDVISSLGIDSAPRGETNIGSALEFALNAFPEGDASHNAIILISDGEDLSGKAVSCAKKAAELEIPIFCVGIGDESGATIPDAQSFAGANGVVKHKGEAVVTKLDNKTLQAIANVSKGAYIPLATAGTGRTTLGDVFNRYITRLVAKDLEEQKELKYIERYQLFLFPSILCFLAMGMLSRGRPGAARKHKKATLMVLLLATIALNDAFAADNASTNQVESNVGPLPLDVESEPAESDSGPSTASLKESPAEINSYALARKAQKEYNKENFEAAAKLYDLALLDSKAKPELIQLLYFNSGVAWLACTNYENAIKAFDCVTEPAFLSKANEALGYAKYKLCIEEIDAYNDNPDNIDENGLPKDFEKAIKAKDEHIEKLQESLNCYREAAKLLIEQDASELAQIKGSIEAITTRITELVKEKKLFELLVKHGGKPYEVQIDELATGLKKIYEEVALIEEKGMPNQVANNKAVENLEALLDQWELGRTSIGLKYFLISFLQKMGKNPTAEFSALTNQFMALDATLNNYNALRTCPEAKRVDLSKAEKTALRMQLLIASPPAILEQAIEFQTNACENVVKPASLYTPIKYQQGAANFGLFFCSAFPQWIENLKTLEDVNILNQEVGGNCYDIQKLEKCKAVSEEALAEIATLSTNLVQVFGEIFVKGEERSDALTEMQLSLGNEALNLMQQIYALLFPKDEQQDKQDKQQQNKQDKQKQNKQDKQKQQQKQQQNKQQNKQQQDQQSENQQSEEQQSDNQLSEAQQSKEQQSEEQSSQIKEQKEKLNEKETRELLLRLLMQERERKEQKRKRDAKIPMDRNTRDW